MSDSRFISEAIAPIPGRFEIAKMVRGEPGLPPGFVWRGEEQTIEEVLEAGKTTDDSEGEAYVRRHTWRLRMSGGEVWRVYFLRQPPKGRKLGAKVSRWFLLSVSPSSAE